jgi:hypothetical protein
VGDTEGRPSSTSRSASSSSSNNPFSSSNASRVVGRSSVGSGSCWAQPRSLPGPLTGTICGPAPVPPPGPLPPPLPSAAAVGCGRCGICTPCRAAVGTHTLPLPSAVVMALEAAAGSAWPVAGAARSPVGEGCSWGPCTQGEGGDTPPTWRCCCCCCCMGPSPPGNHADLSRRAASCCCCRWPGAGCGPVPCIR